MNKALWILVAALMLGSASGIYPPLFGAYAMSFSILLAMVLLAIAQRRKLAAQLKPGERQTMPKGQKVILFIWLALAIGLVLIGSLTKQ
ncbi:MAG: hypothetical protein HZY77_03445 [Thiobacillus sp.]|uniref:hypothetical protein n=1 Tax=Thiobacillus sp. TaxID=924 RepID=UPI00168C4650|nr:hypothetical protein [Thiobacillus sp.]QLQ02049.1 MAG: hypothetical protein HZY77_03445 [Thiobacillus sp.]